VFVDESKIMKFLRLLAVCCALNSVVLMAGKAEDEALFAAIKKMDYFVMRNLLLAENPYKRANIHARDSATGDTPLICFAKSDVPLENTDLNPVGPVGFYNVLRTKGARFTDINNNRRNVFHEACATGKVFFLAHHMEPDSSVVPALAMQDNDGNTPLHLAAGKSGDLMIAAIREMCDLIVRNPTLHWILEEGGRNRAGKTVEEIAREVGNERALGVIRAAMARVDEAAPAGAGAPGK